MLCAFVSITIYYYCILQPMRKTRTYVSTCFKKLRLVFWITGLETCRRGPWARANWQVKWREKLFFFHFFFLSFSFCLFVCFKVHTEQLYTYHVNPFVVAVGGARWYDPREKHRRQQPEHCVFQKAFPPVPRKNFSKRTTHARAIHFDKYISSKCLYISLIT